MKLSVKQQRILRAVQLRADLPSATIAAKLGLRTHTVSRCIQQLLEAGIIRRSVFVNLSALGFSRYNLLFSRSSNRLMPKQKLIDVLTKDPQTIFVAEIGGEWEYEVSFAVLGDRGLHAYLDRISSALADGFFDKSLVSVLEKHLYGSKYLCPDLKIAPLRLTPAPATVDLTETDHTILRHLANSNCSMQRLAKIIGLPASTIAYRLSRLRKNGVIVGDYYVQNAISYGSLRFKALVYTRGERASLRERIQKYCQKHKNVDLLMVCAGAYDYELVLQAADYSEASAVAEQIRSDFSEDLRQVKIISCFKVHKFSDYPFQDYLPASTKAAAGL